MLLLPPVSSLWGLDGSTALPCVCIHFINPSVCWAPRGEGCLLLCEHCHGQQRTEPVVRSRWAGQPGQPGPPVQPFRLRSQAQGSSNQIWPLLVTHRVWPHLCVKSAIYETFKYTTHTKHINIPYRCLKIGNKNWKWPRFLLPWKAWV